MTVVDVRQHRADYGFDGDYRTVSVPTAAKIVGAVCAGLLAYAARCLVRGKPVAVVGASTGLFGAVWAQAEVRKVLETIGADVIDSELPVGQAHIAFGDDGHLADAGTRDALEGLVAVLAARAGAAEVVAI